MKYILSSSQKFVTLHIYCKQEGKCFNLKCLKNNNKINQNKVETNNNEVENNKNTKRIDKTIEMLFIKLWVFEYL